MIALPQEIRTLSMDQKFELLDALLEDLSAATPGVDDAQAAELESRIQRYDSQRDNVIAWAEVKARLTRQ